MTGSMDAHARSRELAAIALDFPLEPAEQAELEAHAAECASCRAFEMALRRDVAAVRALPEVDAPAHVRRRVFRSTARPARSSMLLLAPLAAVLVLVVAVGPLALQFLFPSSGASTADPSAAATAPAPTQIGGVTWAASQVGPPAAERTLGSFAAVTYVPGRGFAAVGESCWTGPPAGQCSALAATSAEGARWDLAPSAPLRIEPVDGQQAGMRAIANGGPGVIAVGVSGDGDGRPQATVWLSPYGRDWQRVPNDPSFDDAWMNAVTTTRDGLIVAVGGSLNAAGGVDAAVWTSADGEAWSRGVPTVEAEFDAGAVEPTRDGRPVAGLVAVTDLPAGGLVALGASCGSPEGPCTGGQWTSVDGRGWAYKPSDALAEGLPASAVTFEGRVVVVGRSGNEAAIWTTPDGEKWDRVASPPEVSVEGLLLTVTADAGGLRAAGQPPEMWASSDGTDWSLEAADEEFGDGSIHGLASGSSAHVAVGAASGYPAAWHSATDAGPEP